MLFELSYIREPPQKLLTAADEVTHCYGVTHFWEFKIVEVHSSRVIPITILEAVLTTPTRKEKGKKQDLVRMKNKNKQTKFPVVSSICCLFPLKELPKGSWSLLFFSLLMLWFTYPACSLFRQPPNNWYDFATFALRCVIHYVMEFLHLLGNILLPMNLDVYRNYPTWTTGSDKEDHAKRRRGG